MVLYKKYAGKRRQQNTIKNNYLPVGKIVSSFGYKGELKISPYDSWPKKQEFEEIYLDLNNSFKTLKIQSRRRHDRFWLLTFKDTEINSLINQELWLDREKADNLCRDEFYVQDLIGLNVFDHEGKQIGSLVDIMKINRGHDVFVVKNDTNEYLFPAMKKYITEVSIEKQKITVQTNEINYEEN